jgi:hypothetical protein
MDWAGVLGGVLLMLIGGFFYIIGADRAGELERYRNRQEGEFYLPTLIFARPAGVLVMLIGLGRVMVAVFSSM